MSTSEVPIIDLGEHFSDVESELVDAFIRVGRSGTYVLGDELVAFENEVADFLGAAHVVGVANATEGIELCLRCVGIGSGHKVLAPDNTFVGTFGAIVAAGASPVFGDIAEDFNLKMPSEEVLSSVDAVIPVHLYGRPYDMQTLKKACASTGTLVIEDAAQAFGSKCHDTFVGGDAKLAVFSLHPLKNFHVFGDGGLIATNDSSTYEWLTRARNHGLRDRDNIALCGRNSRLHELQAALGRVMLRHFPRFQNRVKEIERYYRENIRLAGLAMPPADCSKRSSNWHNFVIRMPTMQARDHLKQDLEERGVDVKIRYPFVVSDQPAYSSLGHKAVDYENRAIQINQTMLSLPIFYGMSDTQVGKVVEAVNQCGH